MDPAMISLIAMIVDIGIDRAIDIYKLFTEANIDLPALEQIKKESEKWEVRADKVDEVIRGH